MRIPIWAAAGVAIMAAAIAAVPISSLRICDSFVSPAKTQCFAEVRAERSEMADVAKIAPDRRMAEAGASVAESEDVAIPLVSGMGRKLPLR